MLLVVLENGSVTQLLTVIKGRHSIAFTRNTPAVCWGKVWRTPIDPCHHRRFVQCTGSGWYNTDAAFAGEKMWLRPARRRDSWRRDQGIFARKYCTPSALDYVLDCRLFNFSRYIIIIFEMHLDTLHLDTWVKNYISKKAETIYNLEQGEYW